MKSVYFLIPFIVCLYGSIKSAELERHALSKPLLKTLPRNQDEAANDSSDPLAQSTACLELGAAHLFGLDVPVNLEKAQMYFERAAGIKEVIVKKITTQDGRLLPCYSIIVDDNQQAALYYLGKICCQRAASESIGETERIRHYKQAKKYFKEVVLGWCNFFQALAYFEMGIIYAHNPSTKNSRDRAVSCLREVADRRDAPSVAQAARRKLSQLGIDDVGREWHGAHDALSHSPEHEDDTSGLAEQKAQGPNASVENEPTHESEVQTTALAESPWKISLDETALTREEISQKKSHAISDLFNLTGELFDIMLALEKIAEQDQDKSKQAQACILLARCYLLLPDRQDQNKSLTYLSRAAAEASSDALKAEASWHLGQLYFYGTRIEQNYALAAPHLIKAANCNALPPMYKGIAAALLCEMFYKGLGVKADDKKVLFYSAIALQITMSKAIQLIAWFYRGEVYCKELRELEWSCYGSDSETEENKTRDDLKQQTFRYLQGAAEIDLTTHWASKNWESENFKNLAAQIQIEAWLSFGLLADDTFYSKTYWKKAFRQTKSSEMQAKVALELGKKYDYLSCIARYAEDQSERESKADRYLNVAIASGEAAPARSELAFTACEAKCYLHHMKVGRFKRLWGNALYYFRKQQYQDAIGVLEKVEAQDLDKTLQADAWLLLAKCYLSLPEDQDSNKSLSYLSLAMAEGVALHIRAEASSCLGHCYFYGVRVKQDYKQAAELFLRCVEEPTLKSWLKGSAFACLIEMYCKGLGGELNYEKAFSYCQLVKKDSHHGTTVLVITDYYMADLYGRGFGGRAHYERDNLKWAATMDLDKPHPLWDDIITFWESDAFKKHARQIQATARLRQEALSKTTGS